MADFFESLLRSSQHQQQQKSNELHQHHISELSQTQESAPQSASLPPLQPFQQQAPYPPHPLQHLPPHQHIPPQKHFHPRQVLQHHQPPPPKQPHPSFNQHLPSHHQQLPPQSFPPQQQTVPLEPSENSHRSEPTHPESSLPPNRDDSQREPPLELTSMMFKGSGTRLLRRGMHESGATSSHLREMLDESKRDDSPEKEKSAIVLRGTHNAFQLAPDSPLSKPSEMNMITKISNSGRPGDATRLIFVNSTYIFYAIKPSSKASSQGGKVRVLNLHTGGRAILSGHSAAIIDVAANPTLQSVVATVGSEGVALIWRIVEPEELPSVPIPEIGCQRVCSISSARGLYQSLAWHPSKHVVALARGPCVELWDLSDVLGDKEFDSQDDVGDVPDATASFTNQPADPRLTRLQGHNEVVNSVCFSPSGDWLASASDDGIVNIWKLSSFEAVRKLQPDEGRPVNAVHWPRALGFARPSSDKLLYIACDSYRNVQIWDSSSPERCCRLDLPPGPRKLSFCGMCVDSTGSFVIVPFTQQESSSSDDLSASCNGFALIHVRRRSTIRERQDDEDESDNEDSSELLDDEESRPRLDPSGSRFDSLTPFSVNRMILSAFATNDFEKTPNVDDDGDCCSRLQLYCVQSHGIQRYMISADQLQHFSKAQLAPSSPNVSVPPLSRAVTESSGDEGEAAIPLNTAFRPTASASMSKIHILQRNQAPETRSSSVPQMPTTSSQTVSGNGSNQAQPESATKESDFKLALRLETICMEQCRRLEDSMRREREELNAAEKTRTKLLLEGVSHTINQVLPAFLEAAVVKELHERVVPQIGTWVSGSIAAAVKQAVLPNVNNAVRQSLTDSGPETAKALREPIACAFRTSFAEQLLPAFSASFANMFEQIHSTLENGIRERFEEENSLFEGLQNQMQEIQDTLDRLEKKLESVQSSNTVTTSGVVETRRPADFKSQVSGLLGQERFNDAYTLALNASSIEFVLWLCDETGSSMFHFRGPNELTPAVLLALAQQLSLDLSSDGSTKLELLREVLMALSDREALDSVAVHIPVIAQQILTGIKQHSHLLARAEDIQSMRVIKFAVKGLEKMASSQAV